MNTRIRHRSTDQCGSNSDKSIEDTWLDGKDELESQAGMGEVSRIPKELKSRSKKMRERKEHLDCNTSRDAIRWHLD